MIFDSWQRFAFEQKRRDIGRLIELEDYLEATIRISAYCTDVLDMLTAP